MALSSNKVLLSKLSVGLALSKLDTNISYLPIRLSPSYFFITSLALSLDKLFSALISLAEKFWLNIPILFKSSKLENSITEFPVAIHQIILNGMSKNCRHCIFTIIPGQG